MNAEKIAEQINNRMAIIAAHNKAIAQELDIIEKLKSQLGQKKKNTGLGEFVAAERMARITKSINL